MSREGIAVVMSGFPRRSETFAIPELTALRERGNLIRVFATKPGEPEGLQPGAEGLLDILTKLRPGTSAEQADQVAEHLAEMAPAAVHGYFAHRPAEVAWRASVKLGAAFGFSMHAADARKISDRELARRARAATCVVACNQDVMAHAISAGADPVLVPHGVDLARFTPIPEPGGERLRILAVGRLVEKKGFSSLLRGVARLRFPFQLRIVGEGPDRPLLEASIRALGLSGSVSLCGPLTHTSLAAEYAATNVVCVPSIVARSGDRDGLPNVVLEAMASGRAVIASDVGAIGSAVENGVTGFLVRPGDETAISVSLTLLRSGSHRARLADNARQRVERDFSIPVRTARFCDVLETAYSLAPACV